MDYYVVATLMAVRINWDVLGLNVIGNPKLERGSKHIEKATSRHYLVPEVRQHALCG